MGHSIYYDENKNKIMLYWNFDLAPPDLHKKRAGDTLTTLNEFDINANKKGDPSLRFRKGLIDTLINYVKKYPDSHWDVVGYDL